MKLVFSNCFFECILPNEMTNAIISSIITHNSYDPYMFTCDPLSKKGIHLLPCIAIMYSSILNNIVTRYCDLLDMIKDEYNGLRSGRSCLDHISNNNNNNNMLIVQYPPRNISNSCLAPLCAGEWWFN